jgi:D-alanyl-D-alanine carboxypeptidase
MIIRYILQEIKKSVYHAWVAGLILLVAVPFAGSGQPKTNLAFSSVRELEDYMENLVKRGTPQGISIAVVKDTQIVYTNGFGWADVTNQAKAGSETVYHWFSITKVVVAICILQLEEKGLLHTQSRVSDILPFFKVKYPSDSSHQVRIIHLLNHSSGLPDARLDLIRWVHHHSEPSVNQTEMIKKVLPKYSRLAFEPGTQTKYTNIGYMVLSAIIEKVSGLSFEDYVRQNILLPLEMHRTDFIYTLNMQNDVAAGAHPFFDIATVLVPFTVCSYVKGVKNKHLWFKKFYTDQTAPSGLIGPVTDAARLIKAYNNKGLLNGKRVLTEESVNKMNASGFITDSLEMPTHFSEKGIAWMVNKTPESLEVLHTGSGIGFTSAIKLFPYKKIGFIIFSNHTKCKPWDIIDLATGIDW